VAYYKLLQSRRSSKHWLISLICKLWLIEWDLWEHCNSILHNTINLQSSAQLDSVNKYVRKLYSETLLLLSHSLDQYLIARPLPELLGKPLPYKQAWLHNCYIAILHQRQLRGREAGELSSMWKLLERWLKGAR
jgi:hypothetical protein